MTSDAASNAASKESWEEYRRTMRHEMRTPIGHIISYAELVIDDMAEGHSADAIVTMQAIYTAGKQGAALVDRALESQQEPSTDVADPAFAELTTLMNDIIDRVRQMEAVSTIVASPQLMRDIGRIDAAAHRLHAIIGEAANPPGGRS